MSEREMRRSGDTLNSPKRSRSLINSSSPRKQSIERHHVSYKPEIIEDIPRRKHQKIHGNIPIDTPLSRKLRQYDAITKLVASMKNWVKAHEKDFGERPDIGLEHAKELKKQLMKEIKEMIKEDLKKVEHIKGLGVRYLAGILAYAHPNRFPSLRKFLFYCGFKQSSRILKKYNHRIPSLVHRIVVKLIMNKDSKYYPLYKQIKKQLAKKNPDYTKAKINGVCMNRVGTLLLKELYGLFNRKVGI